MQTTSREVTRARSRARTLATLPVAERNYFRLLTLDSNVVASGPGTNGLNVGGGDVWNFGTYVDGTSNFSKWLTLQRAPQRGSGGFALETVKQVQIITNQFSAEFGGHSAGVVNMITKSGTQHLRGGSRSWWCGRATSTRSRRWRRRRCRTTSSSSAATSAGRSSTTSVFFFGSYEHRRERSQVSVTSPEATGHDRPDTRRRAPGARPRLDFRFSPTSNRWPSATTWCAGSKDNESGGLQPAGHRLHLEQQRRHGARHVHHDHLSKRAERGPRSVLALLPTAAPPSASASQINRTGYSITGGNDQGTWGVHPGRHLRHLGHDCRSGPATTPFKTGGVVTYDVTKQRYLPDAERHLHLRRRPGGGAHPFQFTQAFALTPGQRVMYPKAYVFSGFFQDDWRVAQQPHAQPRPALRRRVHEGHSRLAGPTDANNLDPRVGFAWDPRGRSEVVGPRRRRPLHAAAPDLHHRQRRRAAAATAW